MNDYNLWADLLDTFQSSPSWVKALWLLVPPGFVLGVLALILRFLAAANTGRPAGDLVCSIYRDEKGRLHVWSPDGELGNQPRLPAGRAGEPRSRSCRRWPMVREGEIGWGSASHSVILGPVPRI